MRIFHHLLAALLVLPIAPAPAGAASAWSLLPGAPIAPRGFASAVWTGDEMLVWGGGASGTLFADGAAYEPASRTWRTIARAPLRGRTGQVAIWTGREMLVWGGCCDDASREFADGAAYDPARNRWARLPAAPLTARTGHAAVFTGDAMLVWGGSVFRREFADGAAYDPSARTWRPIARAAVAGRTGHTAVWTGREMLVWGGTIGEEAVGDGAAYDAAADAWRALPTAPLRGRAEHAAVWTGAQMLVAGGCCDDDGEFADAATYDPAARTWREGAPGMTRAGPVALAIGDDAVLLWGGRAAGDARPREPEVVVGAARVRGAASPLTGRTGAAAVWTGERMLVWGGCCGAAGSAYGDGASFDPSSLVAAARPAVPGGPTREPKPPVPPSGREPGDRGGLPLAAAVAIALVTAAALAIHRRRRSMRTGPRS